METTEMDGENKQTKKKESFDNTAPSPTPIIHTHTQTHPSANERKRKEITTSCLFGLKR